MADFNPNKAQEAPDSASQKAEKSGSSEHAEHQEDLGVNVDASGILDSMDHAEEGVEAMGNVAEGSEQLGENRRATGGKFQKFKKQLTDEEAKALKDKLLAAPPKKRQMVQEIRHHIHEEIQDLQKQARKQRRSGSYHDLVLSLRRIRELKGILARLFYATADTIKSIWLKVVHGIV